MLIGAPAAALQVGEREADAVELEVWEQVYAVLQAAPDELPVDDLRFLLDVSAKRLGEDPRHAHVCREAGIKVYERLCVDDQTLEEQVDCLGLAVEGCFAEDYFDFVVPTGLLLVGVLRRFDRHEEGLEFIQKISERLPADHAHQGFLVQAKAGLLRDRWRYQEARAMLFEARARAAARGEETDASFAIEEELASVLVEMGAPELAYAVIRPALLRAEALHDRDGSHALQLANLCTTYSMVLLAQGRIGYVVKEVDRLLVERQAALAGSERNEDSLRFNAALAVKVLAYTRPEERPKARRRYLELLERTGLSDEERTRLELGVVRFDTLDGRYEEAAASLDAIRASAAEAGLQIDELLTGIEVEAAYLSLARGDASTLLEQRLAALDARLEPLRQRVLDEPPRAGGFSYLKYRERRDPYAALIELAVRVAGPRAGFEELLRLDAASTLARQLGAPAASLEEVQRALTGPRRGLLAYLPADEGTHVFAVDAEGVVHVSTASTNELNQLIRPFNELVRRSPSGLSDADRERRAAEYAELAAPLSALLIPAKIAERVRAWDAVYVYGRDQLKDLSVECVPLVDGRPLGLTHELGYLPSVQAGVELVRRFERGFKPGDYELDLRLVIEAEPSAALLVRHPRLGRLDLSGDQRKGLVGGFEGARVEVLAGEQASLARLRDPEARAAVALHFVTHGVHDVERELNRGLMLSPDEANASGAIYGAEVDGLPCAPLVLLSACSSALGPERVGDGEAATLVGAFLRNGALAVISTAADAELAPTLRFAAAFQREVAEGATLFAAMRAARLALVDEGFDDPYYYGQVRATGILHRPFFGASTPR